MTDVSECDFYHTMLLPTHGRQLGRWDLIGRFSDYTAGVSFAGKAVLDVGAATGFLSFEAEQRGADVTSFDVDSVDSISQLPIQESDYVRDPQRWRLTATRRLERMKNSYWLCHRDLRSSARCIYGDICDLDETLGVFDIVLVGQILIHVRDGLSALAAGAKVCGETIVITEGSFDNDTPIAALSGRADRPEVAYAWYQYSHGWYREVLAMLGFANVTITTDLYTCTHVHHTPQVELTTIRASR